MKTITAVLLTLFSLGAFAVHEDPCDHHVRDTAPDSAYHCNHR